MNILSLLFFVVMQSSAGKKCKISKIPKHAAVPAAGPRGFSRGVRSASGAVRTRGARLFPESGAHGRVPFRAGGYIQIEAPPHEVRYKDFNIEKRFREDWDKYDLWRYASKVEEPEIGRASCRERV